MSDIEEALARLNVNVARVATALERALAFLERFAAPPVVTGTIGCWPPSPDEFITRHGIPVIPAQPRDLRPSTITT